MVAIARTIEQGRTPSQVVADFAAKGITVSERAVREKARELGACRILGKAMILLPEHIDLIFEAPECQNATDTGSSSTFGEQLGGSRGALKARTNTTAKALEHLTNLSRKPKSANLRRKPSNVLSLDAMRPGQKTG